MVIKTIFKFADILAGTIWGAGTNNQGELGIGSLVTPQPTFTQEIGVATNWKSGGIGVNHTMALDNTGKAYGAGFNFDGQLGTGDKTTYTSFTPSLGTVLFKAIEGGSDFSIGVTNDGKIYGAGSANRGQLGIPSVGDKTTFTQESTNQNQWNKIAAGRWDTTAIRADGTLWGTGFNDTGALGLGDTSQRDLFEQIGTDVDWVEISTNGNTIAIKSDGTMWGTGSNVFGALGLGSDNPQTTFVQIGTDTDWASVACNQQHTAAIKTNGTLWATGLNSSGELGQGDTVNLDVFTQVGVSNSWKQVVTILGGTFALKLDNTYWVTGGNTTGDHGFGDFTQRLIMTKHPTRKFELLIANSSGGNNMAIGV